MLSTDNFFSKYLDPLRLNSVSNFRQPDGVPNLYSELKTSFIFLPNRKKPNSIGYW